MRGLEAVVDEVDYMVQVPNRGKRSVDLATPGGRELLYRLAETPDVSSRASPHLPYLARAKRYDDVSETGHG